MTKPLYHSHFLGAPTLTPYGQKVFKDYFSKKLLKLAKKEFHK